MDQYKPLYLGKAIPADDPSKMTDFVSNKYNAFSIIYDACKEKSSEISDIKVVDNIGNSADTLSIQVSCSKDTMDYIKEATKDNGSVSIKNDVITAKGE